MKKSLIFGVITVGVIIAISVSVFYSGSSDNLTPYNNPFESASDTPLSSLTFSSLITKDTPLKGDPSAPITIIEFGDFQCPNCGRFVRETAPLIDEQYVNTGQVSFAFKHFPVIGLDSKPAAMASQCAKDQGMFWEFHDALYNSQGPGNTGWAKKDNLKIFASSIGLDRESFDSCLDSNKYLSLVKNDLKIAQQMGFQGLPSFIILDNVDSTAEAFSGAHPFPTFQKLLDEKLNR